MLLAEKGLGVGQQDDLVVGRDLVDFAPGAHDEGVVGRDHGDLVDALFLQVVDLLDVWRQVVGLAAWGESACGVSECVANKIVERWGAVRGIVIFTWNGDEDDLLAGPLLAGVELLWHTAGGGILVSDWSPPAVCQHGVDLAMRTTIADSMRDIAVHQGTLTEAAILTRT